MTAANAVVSSGTASRVGRRLGALRREARHDGSILYSGEYVNNMVNTLYKGFDSSEVFLRK